jgi:predicted ATPase
VASASIEDHPSPAARWQVRLLGSIEARSGALVLQRFPSRAVAGLLARLALQPERAHAREELVELLWPGVGLTVGRNRLRQALSVLKSLLEPAGEPAAEVLLADRLHVRVAPGALACDALAFERAWRDGRQDDARALYQGELMPGHYEDWVQEARGRLATLRERLGDAPPAASRSASAPPAAPPVQPAPAPAATHSVLPAYLTRLFGADAARAQLAALVRAERLVTVLGAGGSGKTRLAIEAARALQGLHAPGSPDATAPAFDLAVFVPLAPCRTGTQVGDALLRALQITPGAGDAADALADALAGRHALLLLDNLEQVIDAAQPLVAGLLARLPRLHVLATSRRPLALDGEREFAHATLALPGPQAGTPADGDLAAAAASPALAMFVERARAVRADFSLGARNAPTLVALVRELEGLPLAIELAASRIRSLAPAEMLARLRAPVAAPHGEGAARLAWLERPGPRAGTDARHASMERVVAWSWELLAPAHAQLLAALTVLPAGFGGATAVALADPALGDAALLLDALVAHSLVHRVQHSDEVAADAAEATRFALYQPVRDFAAARLAPPDAEATHARLRRWAQGWVRALPATPPLDALRAEMPNLLAALASAVAHDVPHEAIELLLTMRRSLEDVELPAEGLALAAAAIERCAAPALAARGHSLLGPLLFTAGQVDAALAHAERGLQCPALTPAQRARALHALARVRWRSRRQAAEVEPLLDEADALVAERCRADPHAEPELRASLLALRAFVVNNHHRQFARGEQLHAAALALWEQSGNQHAINSGRYNLAVCAQNANRHAEALARVDAIIESARALHDWRRLSQSLNVRGNSHSGLRQWQQAAADYRECLRTAWSVTAWFDVAFGLWNLPRALAHLRRAEDAVRLVAYAEHFWRTRFGALDAHDLRYLERVRRLAARQLEAPRIAALWREGAGMTVSQAVAVALT